MDRLHGMGVMADRVTVLPPAGRGEMLKRARISAVRDLCEPNWTGKVRVRGVLGHKRKGQGRRRRTRRLGL